MVDYRRVRGRIAWDLVASRQLGGGFSISLLHPLSVGVVGSGRDRVKETFLIFLGISIQWNAGIKLPLLY
jgi:hypothetical protein